MANIDGSLQMNAHDEDLLCKMRRRGGRKVCGGGNRFCGGGGGVNVVWCGVWWCDD